MQSFLLFMYTIQLIQKQFWIVDGYEIYASAWVAA